MEAILSQDPNYSFAIMSMQITRKDKIHSRNCQSAQMPPPLSRSSSRAP